MAYIRAQVILERDGALPEDACVNTYHFGVANLGGDFPASRLEHSNTIFSALQTLYSSSSGIGDRLGSQLSGNSRVKMFDMEEATPRVPFRDEPLISFTPATSGLPAEVAACVSFQGSRTSGVNQARRRGRVFLGPLGGAVPTAGAADMIPSAAFITDVVAAFTAFLNTTKLFWAVYSPTNANGAPDIEDAFTLVTDGWVDNAFDVQRRRGARATARTTFT